jgi:hypothetical protein
MLVPARCPPRAIAAARAAVAVFLVYGAGAAPVRADAGASGARRPAATEAAAPWVREAGAAGRRPVPADSRRCRVAVFAASLDSSDARAMVHPDELRSKLLAACCRDRESRFCR